MQAILMYTYEGTCAQMWVTSRNIGMSSSGWFVNVSQWYKLVWCTCRRVCEMGDWLEADLQMFSSSSGFLIVGAMMVTITSLYSYYCYILPSLSVIGIFLHFSSSSAFLRSLFTQSSRLSCGLPRSLQPSCFFVSLFSVISHLSFLPCVQPFSPDYYFACYCKRQLQFCLSTLFTPAILLIHLFSHTCSLRCCCSDRGTVSKPYIPAGTTRVTRTLPFIVLDIFLSITQCFSVSWKRWDTSSQQAEKNATIIRNISVIYAPAPPPTGSFVWSRRQTCYTVVNNYLSAGRNRFDLESGPWTIITHGKQLYLLCPN